jgi:hypothetical protein
MRAVFYTPAEIASAYEHWAPRLREYAASCRRQNPPRNRNSLSAAELEQCRILADVISEFRDSPVRFDWPYLEVYHGSEMTLLAGQEVFGSTSNSAVFLLSGERDHWFSNEFQGPDMWYGSCWVTIHDQVPDVLADYVAECYPKPGAFAFWVLTKARGGSASHELWKWDGVRAVPVGEICIQCTEEGFIDDFNDLA